MLRKRPGDILLFQNQIHRRLQDGIIRSVIVIKENETPLFIEFRNPRRLGITHTGLTCLAIHHTLRRRIDLLFVKPDSTRHHLHLHGAVFLFDLSCHLAFILLNRITSEVSSLINLGEIEFNESHFSFLGNLTDDTRFANTRFALETESDRVEPLLLQFKIIINSVVKKALHPLHRNSCCCHFILLL